ncbi:MAG: tRNA (adenosine(37)-N6)-dimethylallyltransferase MiaA [Tannerellaceae bacterium]|jgi:tRNA dimethylallyltransferase|nr:tRNA (adenosine(37)-N6)-dimethylallyltransferase MiaA [Tannerellaceae bacterium]
MNAYQLLTVLGPTASGKTAFAAAFAAKSDSEIISADSRQVYRGMDIGTGKDRGDYTVGGKTVPYHLIDICEPGYRYNVFEYRRDFFRVYGEIRDRGKRPVLCGGTGLYIEAVLKGYRLPDVPENPALRQSLKDKPLKELEALLAGYGRLHNKTDVETAPRAIRAIEIAVCEKEAAPDACAYPPLQSLVVGLDISREARRQKISERLHARLQDGMVEEVRGLLDAGVTPGDLMYYGLEYRYLTLYVTGKLSYGDMVSRLEIAIHQFAKRQMTWFRGMERRGCPICWIDASLPMDRKIAITESLLEKNETI